MMTDFLLATRLLEMNSSLQKPRLMYRKSAGAYGLFRPYMSLRDYTTADFLQSSEATTPVLVRFSKTFGKDGEADTGRDIRGFFLKFYTKQGECDFLCHNMPVYYINDGSKLPGLYDSFLPDKRTNILNMSSFWEFAAENPETINIIVWLFSDRGTLKSYRHMEGYNFYTQEWSNFQGEDFYVRMKWEPCHGVRYISTQEAEFLAGFDPEAASRDLYEALENSNYPEYEMLLQILPKGKANQLGFDVSDTAYSWPEEQIPYIKAGKLILNRLPEDFTKNIDGADFSPCRLISGIALCGGGISEAMCFAMQNTGGTGR